MTTYEREIVAAAILGFEVRVSAIDGKIAGLRAELERQTRVKEQRRAAAAIARAARWRRKRARRPSARD